MDARRHAAREDTVEQSKQRDDDVKVGDDGTRPRVAASGDDKIRLPPLASLKSPLQYHLSPRPPPSTAQARAPLSSSLPPPPLPLPLPPPLDSRGQPDGTEYRHAQESPSSGTRSVHPPPRQLDYGPGRVPPPSGERSDQHHHMHHHHHHHHDQSQARQRAFPTRPSGGMERPYPLVAPPHMSSASSSSSSPRYDSSQWIASDQRHARVDDHEARERGGIVEGERAAGWPSSVTSASSNWSVAHARQPRPTSDAGQGSSSRSRPAAGTHTYAGSDGDASSGQWPAHHSRTRARWSASPYEKLSFDLRLETFRQLWDIFITARRYSDGARSSTPSTGGPRPLPSIAEGDLETLSTHLQYEVDILFDSDPRTAEHLANSARSLQMQFHERKRVAEQTSMEQEQNIARRSQFPPVMARGELEEVLAPRMFPRLGQESIHASRDTRFDGAAPSGSYRVERQPATYFPHPYESASSSYSSSVRSRSPPPLSNTPYDRVGGHAAAYGAYGYTHFYPYHSSRAGSSASSNTPATSGSSAPPVASVPRRVRKRHDELDQSCLCCSAHETPEWRKGPTGPRTLCNACGLLYAKQVRKREADLQARGKRSKAGRAGGSSTGSTHDDMTPEEQQAALMELSMAVQVRAQQSVNPRRSPAQAIDDDDDGGGSAPGGAAAT